MRVLQLHTRYRQGGGEDAAVRSEAAALRQAGHVVYQHVVTNPDSASSAALTLAGAVWNPLSARRIAALVDTFNPDIAHVHNTWFALSPSVLHALRRRAVPVVMTVHNYRLACANALFFRDGVPCEDCLGRRPWPAIRHRCYRNNLATSALAATSIGVHQSLGTWSHNVDRFLVLSEFARTRMLRAGLPASKVVLATNFVGDPGGRSSPPSRSGVVLFVGRLSPEKGLDILLHAWRTAAPEGLQLVVVGDGPDRHASEFGAPADVCFLGRQPASEIRRLMLSARALVIPSTWYEGQPMVALESLAAGTPLIVSDIGGLPEIFGDLECGWACEPGNAKGLAVRLDELTDESVDERGIQARLRFEQAFTADTAIARLIPAYLAAAGERANA